MCMYVDTRDKSDQTLAEPKSNIMMMIHLDRLTLTYDPRFDAELQAFELACLCVCGGNLKTCEQSPSPHGPCQRGTNLQ